MDKKRGLLVLDDTTLDKSYAKKMERVTYHFSGKHQRVIKGIALLTLLWTEGKALIPCDFRVYDKPQGEQSKNEHFQAMLKTAKGRGFEPEYGLMDSWYSGLENLKFIFGFGWLFLTRLKGNRMVNPDGKGNVPINQVEIPAEGRAVWLGGFGFVKVFWRVSKEGEAEYWARKDLKMTEGRGRDRGAEMGHRGISSGAQAMLWGGEGTSVGKR